MAQKSCSSGETTTSSLGFATRLALAFGLTSSSLSSSTSYSLFFALPHNFVCQVSTCGACLALANSAQSDNKSTLAAYLQYAVAPPCVKIGDFDCEQDARGGGWIGSCIWAHGVHRASPDPKNCACKCPS